MSKYSPWGQIQRAEFDHCPDFYETNIPLIRYYFDIHFFNPLTSHRYCYFAWHALKNYTCLLLLSYSFLMCYIFLRSTFGTDEVVGSYKCDNYLLGVGSSINRTETYLLTVLGHTKRWCLQSPCYQTQKKF